jgi:hypothetical protein
MSIVILAYLVLLSYQFVNCIENNADWMERNWKFLSERTLQNITLPGTHDSGIAYFTNQFTKINSHKSIHKSILSTPHIINDINQNFISRYNDISQNFISRYNFFSLIYVVI